MNYESNIAVFWKESKLTDDSKTGDDDSKKPREGSLGSYTEEADVFEEGAESADCRKVLFNCLRNLEQKMNDLYMLANSNKEIQIKGDKQLIELTSSVEFLTSKFDELEKERKEKDELINSLQIEVSSLKVEIKNLEKKTDDQEQYSRRNCLLIHGLNETKTENTDEIVLDVINNKLNMEMSQVSIDRSHRLRKRKGQKPRAIIVKFTRYKDRNHVFRNKKHLKGSGISVTESLTLKMMEHLKKAREQHGFANVWTLDVKIMFKGNDSNPKVYYS